MKTNTHKMWMKREVTELCGSKHFLFHSLNILTETQYYIFIIIIKIIIIHFKMVDIFRNYLTH